MSISKLLCFLLICICTQSYGQTDDSIFLRLQGISNRGVDFFNIDGFEITSQKIHAPFSAKNIAKKFKQLKLKSKEIISSDSLLPAPNYYVFKTTEKPEGYHNNLAYYFVQAPGDSIIGITFASINKTDKDFERRFVQMIAENRIPQSIYHSAQIDSIDFAGRKIALGPACHWMGINNVQCPYYGQLNWGLHKDFEGAKSTLAIQFETSLGRSHGKIISEESVDIIFEGIETSATKVIYDFTGVTSVLVGMSGGKTLTIYYVAATVRERHISCVLSFWNNDQINPSGLPPLLEEVMELK